GEYVAVEKIENIYAKSPLVAQIFVYGDSHQIVGATEEDLWRLEIALLSRRVEGRDHGIHDGEADEARLLGFERVKDIHLHPEAFSADKDMITPTFKLKRPQLKAYFQGEIDAMYACSAGIVC
ncbi:unnamed protein product, partial [Aphanomyces euteiches]